MSLWRNSGGFFVFYIKDIMNAATAEALRRSARPNLGKQKSIAQGTQATRQYEFIGIRMWVSHSSFLHPNPIEYYNIENSNDADITIMMMVNDLRGQYIIDLDAMLKPLNESDGEYIYRPLAPFILSLPR